MVKCLKARYLWNLEEQVEEARDEAHEREERKDADDDDGYLVVEDVPFNLVVLFKSEID